jgi:hypothetical protein
MATKNLKKPPAEAAANESDDGQSALVLADGADIREVPD